MTLSINTRPEHAPFPIHASVHHKEVVIPRKGMLVHQVTSPLLPVHAGLVAAFHKAGVGLFASLSPRCDYRVMVLCNMQLQEVRGGEVVLAV